MAAHGRYEARMAVRGGNGERLRNQPRILDHPHRRRYRARTVYGPRLSASAIGYPLDTNVTENEKKMEEKRVFEIKNSTCDSWEDARGGGEGASRSAFSRKFFFRNLK